MAEQTATTPAAAQPTVDEVVAKAAAAQAAPQPASDDESEVAPVETSTLTDLKGNAVGHVNAPTKGHVFAQHRDQSQNEDYQKALAFQKQYPDVQDRINAFQASNQPTTRFDEAKAKKVRAEQIVDKS